MPKPFISLAAYEAPPQRRAQPPNGWPQPLGDAVRFGLIGELIRVVTPQTEADPAALILQFLISFGNMVGPEPHFMVGAKRHGVNLYTVLVGETSKARKGASQAEVRRLLRVADPNWESHCIKTGLVSGEGLIKAISGPDKRNLAVEEEWARVLKSANRTGSVLSDIIRQAWDGTELSILTKEHPLNVVGAHISIIGHITVDELRTRLSNLESINGFGNRFLYACVRRQRCLPEGGFVDPDLLKSLASKIEQAASFARTVGLLERCADAKILWGKVYEELSEGKPGKVGAVTARAEAQVLRLSCVFALLDRTHIIGVQHLRAALEVWRFCSDSAQFLFGQGQYDSTPAQQILNQLRSRGPGGLSRTEIVTQVFARNVRKAEIDDALGLLVAQDLVRQEQRIETEGARRATVRWFVNVRPQRL